MADEDDIESQSWGRSGASRSSSRQTLQDVEVGTSLHPAKVKAWRSLFGTEPKCVPGYYNPHGMLAAQRFVAEREAIKILLENAGAVIVDVGGAPHRNYSALGERGRWMMPAVHIGDSTRRGRAPPEARDYICGCRFEACGCYEGMTRAYLFVHSAYYLDPLVLWRALGDEGVVDALIVEHEFNDVFGGFYAESTWLVQQERVEMRVVGNSDPYIHRLPPWQTGWIGPGREGFKAETLFQLDGCTYVKRLHRINWGEEYVTRPLIWDNVEADAGRSGPIQFSSATRNAVEDNARFTHVTFDVRKVHKIGPFLYTDFLFRGEEVTLTVPISGVSQVAVLVMNRERTPAMFEEATHIIKNRYARSRIPPALLAQTLSAIVALGFVVNLHNETNLLFTMTSRFSWLMNVHSVFLSFGNVVVRSWFWLAATFVTLLVGLIAFDVLDDDTKLKAGVTIIWIVFVSGGCCCCLVAVRLHGRWRRWTEAGWVASLGDNEGPTAPLLGHGFTLSDRLPLPGSRYVRPPPAQIQGQISVGATREKVKEDNRMLVSGIVADGALPSALATTQQAEISAVTNRVLKARREPDLKAVSEYKEVFGSRDEFKQVTGGVKVSLERFNQWLKKLGEAYPKTYVDNMREVWKHYQGVEVPPGPTKAFLKIEKSAKTVGVEVREGTKPRLIQPGEDYDKAITGPFVWQLYDNVKKTWDGIKTKVLYASGYTTDYVGARVDEFLERNPDAVGWSVDMASYDTTLSLYLQEPVFYWYVSLGMPKWVISWLTRVRTRGVTPNGVYYKALRYATFEEDTEADEFVAWIRKKGFQARKKGQQVVDTLGYLVPEDADPFEGWELRWVVEYEDFQMTSGRMDTNLTDTVALVASILTTLPPELDFLLLACGDDGFLMLPKQHADVVERIQAFQEALGLNPEGTVTGARSKWEFCSKLFWWGQDPKTGKVQTVLGPKPFRGIARMGMNTTLPGAANASAAAQSVAIDAGHVPFLGPMAVRTKELCQFLRIRPTGRPEWTSMRASHAFLPSERNFVITQERYGLGKKNEDEFKRLLATLKRVPIVVSYPPLKDAVAVDEA